MMLLLLNFVIHFGKHCCYLLIHCLFVCLWDRLLSYAESAVKREDAVIWFESGRNEEENEIIKSLTEAFEVHNYTWYLSVDHNIILLIIKSIYDTTVFSVMIFAST